LLYLALGLILGGLMTAFGPKRPQRRPQAAMTEETRDGI
jgi:polar amino acid transport system permease protein